MAYHHHHHDHRRRSTLGQDLLALAAAAGVLAFSVSPAAPVVTGFVAHHVFKAFGVG
jgi:hypothetical protein